MNWLSRNDNGPRIDGMPLAALALIAALTWAGCSYEVRLIPREDEGSVHITKVWVDSFGEAVSGNIELEADGVRYTGIYVSSPSDYGLTLLREYCPRYGSMVHASAEWYGYASLKTYGGRTLRCEYKGSFRKGGYGVCLSSEGKIYDLLILR